MTFLQKCGIVNPKFLSFIKVIKLLPKLILRHLIKCSKLQMQPSLTAKLRQIDNISWEMWTGQETLARSIWFVEDKKFGSKGTTKIFSQISLWCWLNTWKYFFPIQKHKNLNPGVKWKSVSGERSVMHNQAVVDSKDERWRWICVLCWCSILDIGVFFQGCFFFNFCIFSRMFLFYFC